MIEAEIANTQVKKTSRIAARIKVRAQNPDYGTLYSALTGTGAKRIDRAGATPESAEALSVAVEQVAAAAAQTPRTTVQQEMRATPQERSEKSHEGDDATEEQSLAEGGDRGNEEKAVKRQLDVAAKRQHFSKEYLGAKEKTERSLKEPQAKNAMLTKVDCAESASGQSKGRSKDGGLRNEAEGGSECRQSEAYLPRKRTRSRDRGMEEKTQEGKLSRLR